MDAPARDYRFVGRLCLDFASTGARSGPGRRFEVLHEPADLEDWLAACSLGLRGARADRGDLRAGWALRDAIWAGAQAALRGEPPPPEGARALSAAAARPPLAPRIDPETGVVGWARPSAAAALSQIARDAIDLLGSPARRVRIRECAADNCALVFYDDSRPGRRRWCEGARCGDRARVRAFRERHRAGGRGPR